MNNSGVASRRLQRHVDQAVHIAQEAIEFARKDLVHAFAQASGMCALPIALWRGDDTYAAGLADELLEHSSQYTMAYWQSWAHHYRAILAGRGAELKGAASAGRDLDPPGAKLLDHLITCHSAFVTADALERVRDGQVGWCAPEILRAHGEALLTHGGPEHRPHVEALFHEALETARSNKAWSWELRAASSLAGFLSQDRRIEAVAHLAGVLERQTEGAETADVRAAVSLHRALS